MNRQRLSDSIAAAEAQGMRIGCCIAPANGELWAHREREVFRSASTIKVAILLAACRLSDQSTFDWNERVELRDEQKAAGSGVLAQLDAGAQLTWRDLAYLMMSISDNTATNMLIERVDMAYVNRTIQSLGMTATALRRPMRGRAAERGEPENETTPYDMAMLINAVLAGEACSAEQCEFILRLLSLQQNDRRIGSAAPSGARWGSKTGSLTGVVNDVGFIERSDGPTIISVFVDGCADDAIGEQVISRIAQAAMADAEMDDDADAIVADSVDRN